MLFLIITFIWYISFLRKFASMKKYFPIIFLIFFICLNISAQNTRSRAEQRSQGAEGRDITPAPKQKVDSVKQRIQSAYAWKVDPRLGERTIIAIDTSNIDFHRTSLVDNRDVAVGYLANIGTPAQSKIFFDRSETSRFTFGDAMQYWRKGPEDQLFRNLKVPYSNIFYQSGGGGQSKEEHFKTELSSNFGKKLNVGFNFDYLYARGFYTNLYNKQINYDFNASYIGDKYKMHAFVANNNFNNSENGGISNPLYITNPDNEAIKSSGFRGNSLDIPTRVPDGLNVWNRLRGRHIFVTNRYDLGNDMEQYAVNDSASGWRKKENYVSPASVILTTHYSDQRRRILSSQDAFAIDSLFRPYVQDFEGGNSNSMLYSQAMNDYMSYYSFKNTLALAMNEGFREWTKFGLTAFIEYDMRKYSFPTDFQGVNTRESQNALFVGGVLSKEQGKYLKYKATGAKDLLNADFRLEGEIETQFPVLNKDVSAKATASIKNITPSFFDEKFRSKYWSWDRNFKDTKRVYIGGELSIPSTKTKISGGVENLTDYIYYGSDRLPAQSSDLQVVSLRLDQQLQFGNFHWDNQLVYQTTTNDEVIPLPALSVYSNLYLKTKIAKVLTLQLGVDAHYHTKYYAPGYEMLTMQFYNQRERKIGNFPISTAYINLHLKYTKFFLMMYNIADGLGSSDYFSLHGYPVAPRMLKLGVSWDFYN